MEDPLLHLNTGRGAYPLHTGSGLAALFVLVPPCSCTRLLLDVEQHCTIVDRL